MRFQRHLRLACLLILASTVVVGQPYVRTSDLFVESGPNRPDAATVTRDLKAIGWLGDRVTAYSRAGWIARGGKTPASLRPPFAVPVFLDVSNLPAAVRNALSTTVPFAGDYPDAVLLLTPRILVRSRSAADWTRLAAATHALRRIESELPDWQIVECPDVWSASDAIAWLDGDASWSYRPLFARQHATRFQSTALQRVVNDPLFPQQWHFNQPGVNLNLGNVWDLVTGKGINITIVDDGVQISHPDLTAAAWPVSSGFNHNFNSGDPNDPTPQRPQDSHGTSVAGLAGARGFNDIGLAGVAPEASLMGLRLIAEPITTEQVGQAFGWQPPGATVHASNNSWGLLNEESILVPIGPLELAGMRRAATQNRGGLGTVIAFSAGNARRESGDSSYSTYASSRFAIAVAAVNRQGQQSSYSENGMNVAISAFGGEFVPPTTLWTTNISGQQAYAILRSDFPTSEAPIDYTDALNGTSAAAAQVSGAAALLLERNPKLGYRDVKEILMRSAQKTVLAPADAFNVPADPFVDNGGGFSFSHSFGAGLLNLSGAISLAGSWSNLGPEEEASLSATNLDRPIADNDPNGAVATFNFTGETLRVESVEFTVNVTHPHRGDLRFILTSPTGMQSIAQPRPLDGGADLHNFTFTTVRDWGTTSTGLWTLKIVDTVANGIGGTLNSASVNIYGAAPRGAEPIISEGGVITARDFGGGEVISPGTWIEIYGANLSATTRSWTLADFQGNQAPTVLDGVSVTIDGKPAFVSYVSPGQVNAQVPDGIEPGLRDVIVHTSQGYSGPQPVAVNAIRGSLLAPGQFGIAGLQYVVALLPDGAYVLPTGAAIPGITSRPAHPGETITVFGVGFGSVTPATPAGTVASGLTALLNPVAFQFGAAVAPVSYQGLAPGYVGLYQFNLVVPNVNDNDAVPFSVILGGASTSQTLYTAVHR